MTVHVPLRASDDAWQFSGVYTAIVTPFTQTGDIDYDGMQKLLTLQLDGGVDGVVVAGSTGEGYSLDDAEYEQLLQYVIEHVDGQCHVIAGVNLNATRKAVSLAKRLSACRPDALLTTVPYYNKPSQQGIYGHLAALSDAVDTPQILYNVPGRTAVNASAETIARLATRENVVGIKEANDDPDQIFDVLSATPDDFCVLSGNDNLALTTIAHGGVGVVSVISNLLPEQTKALIDTALAGDLATARRLHFELLPMMRAAFIDANPVPIKTALALQGYCNAQFREPLCAMDDQLKAQLSNTLANYCSPALKQAV